MAGVLYTCAKLLQTMLGMDFQHRKLVPRSFSLVAPPLKSKRREKCPFLLAYVFLMWKSLQMPVSHQQTICTVCFRSRGSDFKNQTNFYMCLNSHENLTHKMSALLDEDWHMCPLQSLCIGLESSWLAK